MWTQWIYLSMPTCYWKPDQRIDGNVLFYYAMKGYKQNHSHHFFCSSLQPLAATSPVSVWKTQQSVWTYNPALNFKKKNKHIGKNPFWIQLEDKQN